MQSMGNRLVIARASVKNGSSIVSKNDFLTKKANTANLLVSMSVKLDKKPIFVSC